MEKRKLTTRQKISKIVRGLYTYGYLKFMKGMDIGKNVSISKSATMERAYPKSIHIGDNSRISIEAMVLGKLLIYRIVFVCVLNYKML